MMVIDNKFEIGDTVYLKTDAEQLPRLICGFMVSPNGLLYELAQGKETSRHFDF